MTAWRVILTAGLAAVIAGPLAAPLLELLLRQAGWQSWRDLDRLAELAGHTLLLAGGAAALAVPAGTLLAVLLERSDLPGRRPLRGLTVLALFLPLPLLVPA